MADSEAGQPAVNNLGLVDDDSISRYLDMLFGYVEAEGRFINVRGIGEKGTAREGIFRENPFIPADTDDLVGAVVHHVRRWSQYGIASYVLPATLLREDAHEPSIAETGVIVADMDSGDTNAKQAWLLEHVGPPTMIVLSGGITATGHPKKHFYWKLTEGSGEIARIAELRRLIAEKAGGDWQFKKPAQVIRIPGSVHAKGGGAKPVRILSTADHEYELDDLAERIRDMPGMPGLEPPRASMEAPQFMLPTGGGPGQGGMNFQSVSQYSEKPPIGEALLKPIDEGGDEDRNRWSEFSRVAGHYLHCARVGETTIAQAVESVRGWMLSNMRPPWPEARFRQEMTALYNRDLEQHGPMPMTPAAEGEVVVSTELRQWRVGAWAMSPPPPRRFLVDGLIQCGVPHVLAAEGGAGKTFMVLDLALRLAAVGGGAGQCSWMGNAVTEHAQGGNVVLITAEDDKDEIHRRLQDINEGGMLQHAADKLIVLPLANAGGAFPIVMHTQRGEPMPSTKWAALVNALREIHNSDGPVTAVIVDTLAATLHGEEINSGVITEYFSELSKLCGELGAATITTHHIRKVSAERPIKSLDDMREAIRGSGAVLNSTRGVIGVWHASDYARRMKSMGHHPAPKRCYRMGVVKANNPEFSGQIKTLLRADSGMLVDVSPNDRVERITDREIEAWLVMAIKIAAQNRAAFAHKGGGGLFARRAELPVELQHLPRRRLESVAEDLIARRVLVKCRPASSRGGHAGTLDVPGGIFASGNGYLDQKAWAFDWSGYYFDETINMVVEAHQDPEG